MRNTIIIFSCLFFSAQIATAQEGVRSVKKASNSAEAKTTIKVAANNEKFVAKDSTSNNAVKNNNAKKNLEKTSPDKKN